MELCKINVERLGNSYTDLYLSWEYEGKKYYVRVRPVFARDYNKMIASATPLQEVPTF